MKFSIENEIFKPRMKISSENENFVRGGRFFFFTFSMRSGENNFFRSPGPLGTKRDTCNFARAICAQFVGPDVMQSGFGVNFLFWPGEL